MTASGSKASKLNPKNEAKLTKPIKTSNVPGPLLISEQHGPRDSPPTQLSGKAIVLVKEVAQPITPNELAVIGDPSKNRQDDSSAQTSNLHQVTVLRPNDLSQNLDMERGGRNKSECTN